MADLVIKWVIMHGTSKAGCWASALWLILALLCKQCFCRHYIQLWICYLLLTGSCLFCVRHHRWRAGGDGAWKAWWWWPPSWPWRPDPVSFLAENRQERHYRDSKSTELSWGISYAIEFDWFVIVFWAWFVCMPCSCAEEDSRHAFLYVIDWYTHLILLSCSALLCTSGCFSVLVPFVFASSGLLNGSCSSVGTAHHPVQARFWPG